MVIQSSLQAGNRLPAYTMFPQLDLVSLLKFPGSKDTLLQRQTQQGTSTHSSYFTGAVTQKKGQQAQHFSALAASPR